MSQQDSNPDSRPDATGPAPADTPKKKRGFWGWLTGRSEEPGAQAQAGEQGGEGEAPTGAAAGEPVSEAPAQAPAPDAEPAASSAAAEPSTEPPATPSPPAAQLQAPAEPSAEASPQADEASPPTEADAPQGAPISSETAAGPTRTAGATPVPVEPVPAEELAAPPAGGSPTSPAEEPAPEASPSNGATEPVEPRASSGLAGDGAHAPLPPALQEVAAQDSSQPALGPAASEEPSAAQESAGQEAPSEAPPSEEGPSEGSVSEGPAPEEAATAEPRKKGFWARLASGLARTASNLGQGITDLVSKRKLDADTLEELEDVLIRADLGVETAMRIVEAVGRGRHDKMIAPEEVKALIAAEVERILEPVAKPLVVDHLRRPFVVLMVGVNGSGKTTTIGKLAAQWRHEGKKVVLAAGDTFRAAAIDQLKVWGQRSGTKVIAKEPGADAAGVAHDALTEARADGADILLIDTAGRLQNRTELMAELEKIVRVVKKLEPTAPHAVLLVLDATVGQNALSQVEAFTRIAGVTGLVMTKLDGTARGGILVAIAAKHKLPVHLIGVGEAAEDLQPFTARDFARAIAGLE